MPKEKTAEEQALSTPSGPRFELIFTASLIVGALAMALGFVLLSVLGRYGFPSTFVAILLGLALGAAVHKFLGGVAGAEFSVGTAKLAGTAALIGIVFWLVDGPLQKNMNDVRLIEVGRTAEADLLKLQTEAAKERTARRQLQLRVAELESGAKITESATVAAVMARVRSSTADDDVGKSIVAMHRNRQGPFSRQALQLKARFLQVVPQGTFWFCHDRRPEVQGKDVRFELVDREAGTSEKLTLRAGGDIGLAVCQDIAFDVQLSCDAARELMKLECTPQRGVAWPEGTTSRIFELVATIMNPDD